MSSLEFSFTDYIKPKDYGPLLIVANGSPGITIIGSKRITTQITQHHNNFVCPCFYCCILS